MHLPISGVSPHAACRARASKFPLPTTRRSGLALRLALLACLALAATGRPAEAEDVAPQVETQAAALPDSGRPTSDQPAAGQAAAEPRAAGDVSPRPAVPDAQAAPPSPAAQEIAELREEFRTSVYDPTMARLHHYLTTFRDPKAIKRIEGRVQRMAEPDPAYIGFVTTDALNKLTRDRSTPLDSQYFLYVDRNPAMQAIFVCFYDAASGSVELLGHDLISSGDIKRGADFFETPTGVFEHVLENFDYRALGTPNAEGWRGLGEKDSRVWDFGYQTGLKTYKNGITRSQLRLLLHATDPVAGEERLGRIDSKGCIRISKGLNHFLDIHAILDMHYEEWAKTKPANWLLRKERKPVAFQGKYLVVGDSSPSGGLQTAAAIKPQP